MDITNLGNTIPGGRTVEKLEYGALWGCIKKTNAKITSRRFKIKFFVNAPWYNIRNDNDLHRDLKMEYINEKVKKLQ